MEPAPTPARRARLLTEVALIYGVVPVLFWAEIIPIRALHPMLFAGTLGVLLLVRKDPKFERISLWNVAGFRTRRRTVLNLFGICSLILIAFMALLMHARNAGWFEVPAEVDWFALPRHRPAIYLLLMIGYPLLSVYPQEVIYRTLFFHRYAGIFSSDKWCVAINALLFGWAHILFHNPVAVGLTIAGGALFATTYVKTRSILAATVEHALYGCLLFTLGLGWYFYSGSLRQLEHAVTVTTR